MKYRSSRKLEKKFNNLNFGARKANDDIICNYSSHRALTETEKSVLVCVWAHLPTQGYMEYPPWFKAPLN